MSAGPTRSLAPNPCVVDSAAMSSMVCQSCGENPATFHLTEIKDGNTEVRDFCEACAAAAGISGDTSVSGLLASAVASVAASSEGAAAEGLSCPHCGMTFQEFKRKGRLGCPRDYEVFEAPLATMLQKMHTCSTPTHRGRVPRGPIEARNVVGDRLLQLRRDLNESIAAERYEEAARVRDEIRRIEQAGVDISDVLPGSDDPLAL